MRNHLLFSAVLAHFILKEKLHVFGVLGCVLCVVGSTSIVLHAPQEKDIESVKQVWTLATEPGIISGAPWLLLQICGLKRYDSNFLTIINSVVLPYLLFLSFLFLSMLI